MTPTSTIYIIDLLNQLQQFEDYVKGIALRKKINNNNNNNNKKISLKYVQNRVNLNIG